MMEMSLLAAKKRFHNFDDGLLLSISLSYDEAGKKKIVFTVNCKDHEAQEDSWLHVQITLINVVDYRFHEQERTTAQVLSSGIHFLDVDGQIGVELGDFADPPESLSELRTSNLYVVAKDVSIENVG
jgi:hypothetical protein